MVEAAACQPDATIYLASPLAREGTRAPQHVRCCRDSQPGPAGEGRKPDVTELCTTGHSLAPSDGAYCVDQKIKEESPHQRTTDHGLENVVKVFCLNQRFEPFAADHYDTRVLARKSQLLEFCVFGKTSEGDKESDT